MMVRRRSLTGILAAVALSCVLLAACETSEPNKATPVAPVAPTTAPVSQPTTEAAPVPEGAPSYPYPYPAP